MIAVGSTSPTRALDSALLLAPSPARTAIYGALVTEPHREWTIQALAELLPTVGVQAVQTVVGLLLDDNVVIRVNRPKGLSFRLARDGALILSQLLIEWGQDLSMLLGKGRLRIAEVVA